MFSCAKSSGSRGWVNSSAWTHTLEMIALADLKRVHRRGCDTRSFRSQGLRKKNIAPDVSMGGKCAREKCCMAAARKFALAHQTGRLVPNLWHSQCPSKSQAHFEWRFASFDALFHSRVRPVPFFIQLLTPEEVKRVNLELFACSESGNCFSVKYVGGFW